MKLKFGKIDKPSSDDFFAKLLSIVLPVAFQQFMLALVGASDALMLGKLTQDALSAVSLASQVFDTSFKFPNRQNPSSKPFMA